MERLRFLGLAAALIASGLLLRLVPWGLPLPLHHYAGGFLWGGMIYALVTAIGPSRWPRSATLLAAIAIIAAVESFRLVHSQALDAFRLTLAGQLLLGRVFSSINILVDSLGAATIAILGQRIFPRW